MINLLLVIVTIVLTVLAVSGYDQYLATKVRTRMVRERIKAYSEEPEGLIDADSMTKMRVKKIKATKIGSYLVITLVISDEGSGGESIEIDDPTFLLPLVSNTEKARAEESIT